MSATHGCYRIGRDSRTNFRRKQRLSFPASGLAPVFQAANILALSKMRVDVVASGREGPDTLSLIRYLATCSSSGRAIALCLLVKSLVLSQRRLSVTGRARDHRGVLRSHPGARLCRKSNR
jgi:hypothetical protein